MTTPASPLERLQDPTLRWPLVFVCVAILIQLRLIYLAIALPALVYYFSQQDSQREEGVEEEGEGEDLGDELGDEGADAPVGHGGADSGTASLSGPEDLGLGLGTDEADPYDSSFWGLETQAVTKATVGPTTTRNGTAPKPAAQARGDNEGADDFLSGLGDFSDDLLGAPPRAGNVLGGGSNMGGLDDILGGSLGPVDDDLLSSDFGVGFGSSFGGSRGRGGGRGKGKEKGEGGKGGGKDGPRPPDPRQVFIAGIGDFTEDELREFFEAVGEVDRLKVLANIDGTPKGIGFVTYRSELDAQKALQLSGRAFQNRRIIVQPAHGGNKEGKDGGKGQNKGASFGRGGPSPRGFSQDDELDGVAFGGHDGSRGSGRGGGKSRGKGSSARDRDDGEAYFRGGGERKRVEEEPRGEIDDLLEEALQEEDVGPLQCADFDAASKRFLTELMRRDRSSGTNRSVEALDMIFKQTRSKEREDVRKWTAYVYMLLQKFDPAVSEDIAQKRLLERDAERRERGGGAGVSGGAGDRMSKPSGIEPRLGDVQRAWECVPKENIEGTKQVLDRWGKPVLI